MRIGEAVKVLRRTLIKLVGRFVIDDRQGMLSEQVAVPTEISLRYALRDVTR
jgi:hypothetical protein